MKTPVVFTVSQLNTYIKSVIDSDENLSNVYVCAEISNLADRLVSGHFYMTSKTARRLFKRSCSKRRATAEVQARKRDERYRPRKNIGFRKRRALSTLHRRYAPDGLGALNLAFEQLKRKLEAEGLFNSDRKNQSRNILRYRCDHIRHRRRCQRYTPYIVTPLSVAQVVLCPVQVQVPLRGADSRRGQAL